MAGNKNSGQKNHQLIRQRLLSLLREGNDKKMISILKKAVELAENGDQQMIKEIFDRVDGKPRQAVDLAGDSDQPIIHRIERLVIDVDKDAQK